MGQIPMAILKAFLVFSVILATLMPSLTAENILYPGESLSAGQSLTYDNYQFTMRSDCNLVLYDRGNPVWATNTGGRGSYCYLTMQRDGNLVVYDQQGSALWASNTSTTKGFYILVLQRDRNVVLYGGARWATGSNAVSVSSILGRKMGLDNNGGAVVVVSTQGEPTGSVIDV